MGRKNETVFLSLIAAVVWLMAACVAQAQEMELASKPAAQGNAEGRTMAVTALLPRPQVAVAAAGVVRLAPKGGEVGVRFRGGDSRPATLAAGLDLLSRRVQALGGAGATARDTEARVIIERMSADAFHALLLKHGVKERLASPRLEQAYTLSVGDGGASVRAVGDLGLFYGMGAVIQLLEADEAGGLSLPAVEIVDWPRIGYRLGKERAMSDVDLLRRATAWFGVLRINLLGVHYFDPPVRKPPQRLFDNLSAVAAACRRRGTPEMIVYFNPFATAKVTPDESKRDWSGTFDFRKPDDCQAYADLLERFMDLGARGIQVDYNDWPDRKGGAPMEDVLNLAYRAARRKDPTAYVLFCPPMWGKAVYFGPASDEMRRVLSHVPEDIWVLWTGPKARMTESRSGAQNNYKGPLRTDDIRAWTEKAGRRPFFWLNRVTSRDSMRFAVPCPGDKKHTVFRGEWLPENLADFIQGIHLNQVFGHKLPDRHELVYFATTADFLWNPRAWDAADACRRARRFVDLMRPLVEGARAAPTPASAE